MALQSLSASRHNERRFILLSVGGPHSTSSANLHAAMASRRAPSASADALVKIDLRRSEAASMTLNLAAPIKRDNAPFVSLF